VILKVVPIEIILSDIGWDRMLIAIQAAMTGTR
jgi:hypothetical protein